jgi:hypothetical protein
MADICVAHLVRASNGIEPLKGFLESYRTNRGGAEHDLLVIFKGFAGKREGPEYQALLAGCPHKSLFVPDVGFDVDAYFAAAKSFDYRYFCFLNSFSTLLDKEWLSKIYRAISEKDVGLVGTTGSCESIYTDLARIYEANMKCLPFFSPRRILVRCRLLRWKKHFHPFPNYHIRTNAFMMPGDLMGRLRHKALASKFDAWRFESGKEGLTCQIYGMDLRALVVGRDGKVYEKEEWFESDTFWRDDQGNLLVADNQTKTYMKSDLEEKRRLSTLAWGDKARVTAR